MAYSQAMRGDDWVVEFEFKVDGQGSRVYGDGFAFWAVAERLTDPGSAFGVQERFNGLGVFFDTYANAPHKVRRAVTFVCDVIAYDLLTWPCSSLSRMLA